MENISGVYKIENTITGDFYIGSSKNVKKRLESHKEPSRWKRYPNNPLYLDMQKYGVDKFDFQILAMRDPYQLKETEQEFIEKLQPTYNNYRAKGFDAERRKEWLQSEKGKESCRKAKKKYQQSDNGKESKTKANKKYLNQVCSYNGEKLTLNALRIRFYKAGMEHPVLEAKKFLEGNNATAKNI